MDFNLLPSSAGDAHAYIDVDTYDEKRQVFPDDIELTVDAWVSPRQIA